LPPGAEASWAAAGFARRTTKASSAAVMTAEGKHRAFITSANLDDSNLAELQVGVKFRFLYH